MKSLTLLFILIGITFSAQAQITLVHDFEQGNAGSRPGMKTVFQNKLIFFASTTNDGRELWAYNDTVATLLYDIYPGGSSGGGWGDNQLCIAGGKLFFSARNGTDGNELYMWDGANAPALVKDINTGSKDASPNNFAELDNKLYFAATTDAEGEELWMHDPATNTTKIVADLNPGNAGSKPRCLVGFKNKLYFVADTPGEQTLYEYNPATDMVQHAVGYNIGAYSNPSHLGVCYNTLYFLARTGTYGYELYRYDGSSAPIRITDISPGPEHSFAGGALSAHTEEDLPFTEYKGAIYFIALEDNSPATFPLRHLYKYDPNAPLSEMDNPKHLYQVYDPVKLLTGPSGDYGIYEVEDRLFFIGLQAQYGEEIWMYDGTNPPVMFADFRKGYIGGEQMYFVKYRDNLFFTASGNSLGSEMYRLDKKALQVTNIMRVDNISVYPVPATGMLNFEIDLKTPTAFTITLTDMSGREVYNSGEHKFSAGAARLQADVTQLATGNYCYRITSADGISLASGKVVKQ